MSIRAFLGERFSRTHENQAFDRLYRLLAQYWRDQEERVTLIGNVTCNGHELDALLLKSDAIAVIDFKNYGGRIHFTENGPWLADGVEVKGGAKTNPFKQVQANKFATMNWLKERCPFLDASTNLGHIAGLVLFQQNIEFDPSKMPAKVASWFKVADFDEGVVWLSQLASPSIRLDHNTQDRIVAALNATPFQPPEDEVRIIELTDAHPGKVPQTLSWTGDQKQALVKAERLLSSDELQCLVIKGMASTGKTALASGLASLCRLAGRQLVPLVPNSALAYDRQETHPEWRSIFSHIYDMSAFEEDDKGCRVHPLSVCNDPEDAVYVIDEAQLLSDAYFDLDGERFGSGHTITDFLEFSSLAKGRRKLVLLGDPFQISRGGAEYNLLSESLLKSKKLTGLHGSLEHVIDDNTHSQILTYAVDLVSALRERRFSTLEPPAVGAEIACIDGEAKRNALSEFFDNESSRRGILITYSNQAVAKVTNWIRRNHNGFQSEFPQPGDRIELYSQLECGDEIQRTFVPRGSFGTVVECDQVAETYAQQLKGRPHATVLRFRAILVRFGGNPPREHRFLYIEPFLLAEKPELDPDTLIALRAFVNKQIEPMLEHDRKELQRLKKDPAQREAYECARSSFDRKRDALLRDNVYYRAARIRYAYASTCHHAQGRKWPDLIIDANYEGLPRANEGYFRWLYTALTRSTGHVQLANFSPLTPLDNVTWRGNKAIIDGNLKSLFRLAYPKNAALTEHDLSQSVPEGFSVTTVALANLWLYVAERFRPNGIKILSVRHHPYQEQYVVADQDGKQATLSFRYDGQYDVTGVKVLNGDRSVAERALSCLDEPLCFSDPLAQSTLAAVRARLSTHGFSVEGGVENDWHLRLTVKDSQSRQVAIKVHYSKDGGIGTIEAEKATDPVVLQQLGRVFQRSAELA